MLLMQLLEVKDNSTAVLLKMLIKHVDKTCTDRRYICSDIVVQQELLSKVAAAATTSHHDSKCQCCVIAPGKFGKFSFL